jgi:hypothetical protein
MNVASKKSVVMNGTILFNLALVHHMMNRKSVKAHSIYQHVITLLNALPPSSDSKILRLEVAVLNNSGAWCYENGNINMAIAYFEEMMFVLDEACNIIDNDDDDELRIFNGTTKLGLYGNLRAFLVD